MFYREAERRNVEKARLFKLMSMASNTENLGCYWDPAGAWHRAHGDSKSTSGDRFSTETMKTSDEKPAHRVRALKGSYIAIAPFDMPHESQPSDDDVITEPKGKV